MKILSVLMLLSFASLPTWAMNFTGQLFRSNQGLHVRVQTERGLSMLPVVAGNAQVESTLRELKSYDVITGIGIFTEARSLTINSIDFVSLRRLLGIWVNNSVRVNFEDFKNVTIDFWNLNLNIKAKFNYAVSPGRGNTWRMFFSSQDSVTLGVLTMDEKTAQLEIFDPETGEVAQTYRLQKAPLP